MPNSQQLAAAASAANLTHHRNSSYSRAMSLPVAGTASNPDGTVNSVANNPQDHFQFNANFDKGGVAMDANTNLAGSPILESPSPFQRSGKNILIKVYSIFFVISK